MCHVHAHVSCRMPRVSCLTSHVVWMATPTPPAFIPPPHLFHTPPGFTGAARALPVARHAPPSPRRPLHPSRHP
eukprot:6734991-Prymnesium_polylepis.1